jgi:eukaryotic-like serine/threonine-protein kinase
MPATVTLKVTAGALRGRAFVFDERTTCVIGRSPDCSPRLPDDTEHRTISRHHCLLDINPPDLRVRDFGSLNGTYVNGEKIGQRDEHLTPEEAKALSYPERDLAAGDTITLGETVFEVRIEVPPACASCGTELPGGADPGRPCADCRRAAPRPAPAPVPLDGFTVLEELGRGGMGAVYLARDERTGDEVALKVMLPKAAAGRTARERFLREAEVTRSLRHPNIASLYEIGVDGDGFFFTMEYCSGGSVDRLAARHGGVLPADTAVPLMLQVLDGLEHAHGEGIVHRDLSPHNILVAGDGTAKVSDFGLAKAFDQAGLSGLTRTGAAAGKPMFMPRQQVINFKYARPEVDLWAAAACLYWLLTGRYPRDFPRGRDPWQIVLQNPAVPLRRRDPALPRALADVVDEAVQDQPAIPFTDAADLRRALSAAL